MSISILYHTQNIRGFQLSRIKHSGGREIAHVSQKPDKRVCAACGSPEVKPVFGKNRLIRGADDGNAGVHAERGDAPAAMPELRRVPPANRCSFCPPNRPGIPVRLNACGRTAPAHVDILHRGIFRVHLHCLTTYGAFTPEGVFIPLPDDLPGPPFRKVWEAKLFKLLLDEGRISRDIIEQMHSWKHSGSSQSG